jgi:hypothetical protein
MNNMSDRDLMAYTITEATAIAAALKNVIRDVEGLMYGRNRDGELVLRDYVAIADTNTRPPTDCDSYAWSVRSRLIALAERVEEHLGASTSMTCPCCARTELADRVVSGQAGWKLVVDTHSEMILGELVVPVREWQCNDCAPYSHSEMDKAGGSGE